MTALALLAFAWLVLVTALLWRVARSTKRLADRLAPEEPPAPPRKGRWE